MLFIILKPASSDAAAVHTGKPVVFGFAPHWTLKKLDNVDFSVLTTFAYFGIPISETGSLVRDDIGYQRFFSKEAKNAFGKARKEHTDVVITFTQMNNDVITNFLSDSTARKRATIEMVNFVQDHNLDGINIDIEYVGVPEPALRHAFSGFVKDVSTKLHNDVPDATLTVSVYAASAKDLKLYDIGAIARVSDGIFMMAYDFATRGARELMPTAPLYGHKEGKYWYDISTAVEDFLKVMPPEKLILGVPYYGYNYPTSTPDTTGSIQRGRWVPKAFAQTYAALDDERAKKEIRSGWDDIGKVSWHAYKEGNRWRLVYQEDNRSLSEKYAFIKEKNLAGVGIWALGFDENRTELWELLTASFPRNLAFEAHKKKS